MWSTPSPSSGGRPHPRDRARPHRGRPPDRFPAEPGWHRGLRHRAARRPPRRPLRRRGALPEGPADAATPTGSSLGAVPPREDPADALCARDGLTLAMLPAGARVGTGSPRRAAQLLAARPDLVVVDIRGNVDTRLGRVAGSTSGPGDLDAVVLARAGLARLGRLDAVTEAFGPDVMSPAPGQGALAVEVRRGLDPDEPLARALRALDHRPTHLAVLAERALLSRLEAGCAAPIGATGRLADDGRDPAPRRRGRPPGRRRDAAPRPDGDARRRQRRRRTRARHPARRDPPRRRRRRPRRPGRRPMTATPVLPLSGWRVLVPRPTAGRSPAVVALAAAGAEAVVVPLIETVPPEDPTELDDALLALESGWFGWLVVTSAAAVPVLVDRASGERRQPDAAARRRPGARRRRRARHRPRAAGGRHRAGPACRSAGRPSRGLVEAWPAAHRAGPRCCSPAATWPRPTIADGLRDRGWDVDRRRRVPDRAGRPAARRGARGVDRRHDPRGAAHVGSTVRELATRLGPRRRPR